MTPPHRYLLWLSFATLLLWASGSPGLIWRATAPALFDGRILEPGDSWSDWRSPSALAPDVAGGVPIEPPAAPGARLPRLGRAAPWPTGSGYLRFSASARTLEPPARRAAFDPDDPSTQRSLVLVRFLDAAGARIAHRSLLYLDGERQRLSAEVTVPVPAETVAVRLETFGRGYGGRFALETAALVPLERRAVYPAVLAVVAALWLVSCAVGLRWLVARVGARGTVAIAVTAAVIVWGVGLSERLDAATVNAMLNARVWSALGLNEPSSQFLFKLGHASAFALATMVALIGFGRGQHGIGAPTVFGFIVVAAFASEALQRHLIGRSASLLDIGIDLLGSGAAWGAWRTVDRTRRWRRRTRDAVAETER